jgi:Lrp/AsnC ligand binding domain
VRIESCYGSLHLALLGRQVVAQGRRALVRIAAAISEAFNAAPEEVSARIVSGAADFLLEVVVADFPAQGRLPFDTLLKLPNVDDVCSNFALGTVKPAGSLARSVAAGVVRP